MTLSFKKKSAIKTGDKKSAKTENNINQILQSMEPGIAYKASELAEVVGLQASRTRELLKMLVEEGKIQKKGERRNSKYYIQ